jgi:hypothetical protein
MEAHAAPRDLIGRGMTVGVVSQGAEEVDLVSQVGQYGRDHAAASRRPGERLAGSHDVAGLRQSRQREEIDPFDVANHRNPGHDLPGYAACPR